MDRRSHHWGPRHHWHVASHRWPHSRSRPHWHHPRRRGAHRRHHGRSPHVRCRHHPRARRTRETGGRWDHCPCRRRSREWSRRYLSLLKCSSGFVNQALSLLFHPFLIVVFHILFVLPTTAVCLSHRWRVMGEVCVAVVTIKFRHVAPQAVGNSIPGPCILNSSFVYPPPPAPASANSVRYRLQVCHHSKVKKWSGSGQQT